MEGIQKDLDEASGLQIQLEQLHQELLSGLETLEVKTNWILSKMSSNLPNSKEGTTKLISYQNSLKKTKQNLEGFILQPFPVLNIVPELGINQREILSEVNHCLKVEEVIIGDTFLVKNEPREENEEENDDNLVDYEELIEAEVKIELPEISHELRGGRTVFTEGKSQNRRSVIAEPGTIARPLSTLSSGSTQNVELVNLESKNVSKRRKSEDMAPDCLDKSSKKKKSLNSGTDTEISQKLLRAIHVALSLRTLTALLGNKEVKKVLEEAICTGRSVFSDCRRFELYKRLTNLAYICVRHTVDCSQIVLLKKMKIISYLSDFNKELIGATEEGFKSEVYPPHLAPGIHVDLLLQLLEHGADPLAQSHYNENLLHTFLYSPESLSKPEFFQSYLKIMQKIPEGILRELVQQKDTTGWTPLLKIFSQESKILPLDFLEVFDKAGADFSAKDISGNSFLSYSLKYNYAFEVVEKIIELGGDIHWKGEDGASLLHLAASNGSFLATRLFLEKGLFINIEDNEGLTPLDHLLFKWKAWHFRRFYVRLGVELKKCGGKFNTKPEPGQTLLHLVARDSTLNCELAQLNIHLLIVLGFKVDEADSNGDTPLHLACRAFEEQWKRYNSNKKEVTEGEYNLWEGLMAVNFLIKRGTERVKNKNGETPEDVINQLDLPERVKNEVKKCFVRNYRNAMLAIK